MMNLSSLSNAVIFSIIAALGSLSTLGLIYSGASNEAIIAAVLVQLAATGLVMLNIVFVKRFLNKIANISGAIQRGDFDQRLVLPNVKGDMAKTADRINAMIDVNDAFVREAALALTAAANGRFYRKIRPEGMRECFPIRSAKSTKRSTAWPRYQSLV